MSAPPPAGGVEDDEVSRIKLTFLNDCIRGGRGGSSWYFAGSREAITLEGEEAEQVRAVHLDEEEAGDDRDV